MSDYNVTAVLSAQDKNFSSKMQAAMGQLNDLERSTESSAASMTKMGAVFGAVSGVIQSAMTSIGSCVSDAVKRFDTLNRFPKVMEQIGFGADEASAATEKLTEGIQGLPTSLSEITANAQSLALLTGNLEEATDLSIALNDAFLASGSSGEAAARGLTQYTQMLSTGKVDMESWRTLLETMGVALTDVANEFGYVGETAKAQLYNALQDGTITFDQFNQTLVNLDQGLSTVNSSFVSFADRALTASEGIGTSMQNIRTAVVTGLANIMTSIDNALQSAGMGTIAQSLNGLKDVVKDVFNTISSVIGSVVSTVAPLFKNLAENMDLVAISVGSLVTRFVALKVIDSIRSKVTSFRSSIKDAAETIKKYNSLLREYGSKQKAAAAAEEATAKAKEIAEKAAKAQMEAEKAALDAKEKYTDAMKAENDAIKSGMSQQKAKEAAMKAQTAATDAQVVAEQKKIAAEKLNMQATQAATTAEQTQAAAQTLNNSQISMKTALLGVLSGQTSIATAAQQAFNAALSANPIGFVITAVTTLVSVFSGLAALLGSTDSETEEYINTLEEENEALKENAEAFRESHEEHMRNVEANKDSAEEAGKLVDEIEDLQGEIKKANAEGKDASSLQSELDAKLTTLNATLGDTSYEYDKQTNSLSASTDEMRAYINNARGLNDVAELEAAVAEAEETRAQAAAEAAEYLKEQKDLEDQLTAAEKEYKENLEALGTSMTGTQAAAAIYNQTQAEINEQLEKVNANLKESQEAEKEAAQAKEEASQKLVEANKASAESEKELQAAMEASGGTYDMLTQKAIAAVAQQYRANQEMIANGQILYDQLSEKNQALVDSLNETWNMYYEANTNMWEKLVDDSNLSVQEMIDNMRANQAATEEMATNLGNLRNTFAELGLDTAVLDQLESLGIESANEIANLAAATPELLKEYVAAYEAGGESAGKSLTTGLGTAAENMPEAIQNLVGSMEQGLADQIAAADWASLGEDQIRGIVEGIDGMTDDAVDATVKAAEEQYKGYELEIQSGSPSKVYAGYGEDQMTGIMQGVNKRKGQALTLMQSVARLLQDPFRTLKGKFENFGVNALQGFINGLNAMRRSVITTAQSIANAAADTIARALEIGSPSRLLEKYGVWSGEGYDKGLARMIRPVEKTAAKLTSVLSSIFIPRASDYQFSGNLAIEGGYVYNMDGFGDDIEKLVDSAYNRPIRIDNVITLDGRTLAKAATPYITEEQKQAEKFNNHRKGVR